MTEDVRIMECPFCGHRSESTGIGWVYCGPHGSGHGLSPARKMYEVDSYRRDHATGKRVQNGDTE